MVHLSSQNFCLRNGTIVLPNPDPARYKNVTLQTSSCESSWRDDYALLVLDNCQMLRLHVVWFKVADADMTSMWQAVPDSDGEEALIMSQPISTKAYYVFCWPPPTTSSNELLPTATYFYELPPTFTPTDQPQPTTTTYQPSQFTTYRILKLMQFIKCVQLYSFKI
ncbi:hypothetical protein DPMN_167923 [Dreissena polymorpha]|uniref:Uncharacterized protein n=1 Tax=Dreissena polymorpha TaxID=45954 RepID=A0A9D4F1M3_DREPO|nr:hypothetical protein DPMN_167923 [Dreissena polymorpha]